MAVVQTYVYSENLLRAVHITALIPVENIEAGECYAVVIHFADGSTAVSEVMKKQ